jgi:transcriptional regulator with XRE-family HTH domain
MEPDAPNVLPLGLQLRAARKRRQLTQTEAAEKLGLSVRQLIRLELGDAQKPSDETVRKLKRVFGIDAAIASPMAPDVKADHEIERLRARLRKLERNYEQLADAISKLAH